MIVREFVLLSRHTTFKIGGLARYFLEVSSITGLKDAVEFARRKNLPWFVLGGGSNILFGDHGYPGVIIHLTIPGIEWEEEGGAVRAVASAGVPWDDLVQETVRRGLWGLENLSGIPGTVGASVIQNIGAYGAEIATVLEWVEVYDTKIGAIRKIPSAECELGYRDSMFKHVGGVGLIITRVAYRLTREGSPNISYADLAKYFDGKPAPGLLEVREAVLRVRSGKFPDLAQIGTAGSFFKNPVVLPEDAKRFLERYPGAPSYPAPGGRVKLSAAWIIDRVLGMKGFRDGPAGVWKDQPLVLVNYGGATAIEIRMIAQLIQDRSETTARIHLSPEVVIVE